MSAEIIISIITSIAALVGGGAGIIYWRENKQLKAAEVKQQLADAEYRNAETKKILREIETQRSQEWQELYRELQTVNKKLDDELRAAKQEIFEKQQSINSLGMQVERLSWYRCTRNGCLKRQPPRKFDSDDEDDE